MDDERRLLLAADGALGCVGLYAGALGPSLSTFAADAGVSLGNAGLLITALASGGVAASALVTFSLYRRSQRRVAAVGMTAMAATMLGLAVFDNWWLLLVAAVFVGASGGLADSGTHGIAAKALNPARAVARLNVAFALGAIIGPAVAGVVLQFLEWRWLVFSAIALAAAVVAVALWTAPEPLRLPSAAPAPRSLGAIPVAALAMGLLLFLYVGAEVGLGAWTTAFTRRAADASLLAGALVTSSYWAALFFGRVANGYALDRGRDPARILLLSIVGAGIGCLVLVAGGQLLAVGAAGAFLTGFCFGPIWPSSMALALRDGNDNTPAMLVTVGNGGGILLPWVQGKILVEGGTRAGMTMSALLCVGMLALALATAAAEELVHRLRHSHTRLSRKRTQLLHRRLLEGDAVRLAVGAGSLLSVPGNEHLLDVRLGPGRPDMFDEGLHVGHVLIRVAEEVDAPGSEPEGVAGAHPGVRVAGALPREQAGKHLHGHPQARAFVATCPQPRAEREEAATPGHDVGSAVSPPSRSMAQPGGMVCQPGPAISSFPAATAVVAMSRRKGSPEDAGTPMAIGFVPRTASIPPAATPRGPALHIAIPMSPRSAAIFA